MAIATEQDLWAVRQLAAAGYTAKVHPREAGRVLVEDPVACSCGSHTWTEHVTLSVKVAQVTAFIEARS